MTSPVRPLLLLALAACAPHVDPLAPTRAALAEAQATPAADLPAHAVVRASDTTLGALVADLAVGTPLTAPGPFGMRLVLIPEVEHAVARAEGDGPLQVHAELEGTTDIVFPLLSAKDLPWDVTVDGTLGLEVVPTANGLQLGLRWADPDALGIRLGLGEAPEAVVALAEGAVRGALVGALGEQGLAFALPDTPWAEVRDLRVEGDGATLTAHLVLSGVGGAPPPLPDVPEDGAVLAISDASLLGIARALALRQPADAKLVVDPLALTLAADRVVADVRVHRRARRARWRTYRIEGPLIWEGSHLALAVDDLALVEHEGWRGGWRVPIGEKRAVALLQDGLDEVPTTLTAPMGDRALHVELVELRTVDGALQLVTRFDMP